MLMLRRTTRTALRRHIGFMHSSAELQTSSQDQADHAPVLRNVAIIAHVDHGKTTLVDALLRECGEIDDEGNGRVMDKMDQEKERGITITSKITGMRWKGTHLNIVDTPGHADFGGEVERVLQLVDGVVIVCDATEGPNTQTRYVTSKALERGLKPLVVINKVDRETADIASAENAVFDLFMGLNASDEQLEFPFIHASARSGWAVDPMTGGEATAGTDEVGGSMGPLLDAIVEHLPPPTTRADKPSAEEGNESGSESGLRLLVTMMSHDAYLGRLLTGKVIGGTLRQDDDLRALNLSGEFEGGKVPTGKVTQLMMARGMAMETVSEAPEGSIVTLAGIPDAGVTDTLVPKLAAGEWVLPIPTTPLDPPTVAMTFSMNSSPFAGQEGTKLNSSQLSRRLELEAMNNVSISVNKGPNMGSFEVCGRGDLQLAVLIETLRREGFEMSVSPPRVLERNCPDTGNREEPFERVEIDIPDEYCGTVMEKLNSRRGQMLDMIVGDDGRTKISYLIPARALLGYRTVFQHETHGSGVLNKTFDSFGQHAGHIEHVRTKGALVSTDSGQVKAHALGMLEARGTLFAKPQDTVYEGMIIGEHTRDVDLQVNPCKGKQLTNMRESGSDDTVALSPPRLFTLEEALGYVRADEILEVTPVSVRMRKLELDAKLRQQAARRQRQMKKDAK